MKKKGFTLIELLAVIIILAVIALIATPIVLNVVDNARESARKSSVNGYADATRMAIYDYQFANNGSYPSVDKVWAETNAKTKGDTVNCEEVHFSTTFEVVMHKCTVGTNTKEYCHANGKTYEDCENEEYKNIYANLPAQPKNLTEELKKQYSESNTVGLLKEGDSYYYKGTNEEVANNFVWFGGHLWRVLTINKDNSLTMITQQPITAIFPASKVWTAEQEYEASYINTWLNDETDGVFYKSLAQADKNKIQNSTFNVGGEYNSATGQVENIGSIQTTQKVGLLDETEYTKAGGQNSFLDIKDDWLLGNILNILNIRCVDNNGHLSGNAENAYGVRPVINISNLTFTEGKGTLENPYREKSSTTNTTNIKVGEYISVPTSGTDCGNDNRCLFRVVSKEGEKVKVTMNGLLPNKSAFDSNSNRVYTSGNTIDTVLITFTNTIDNKYRYQGSDAAFGIGAYEIKANFTTVKNKKYLGVVGLPVVGEMFTANDIEISGLITKTFVNVNTIENSTVTSWYWLMNSDSAYSSTSRVWNVNNNGSLGNISPLNKYGIRPVLFLNNNLSFTGGEGTAENPFILD